MRRLRKTKQTTNQPSRLGAAMVEMALVMPVFLLFLLGTIELGRALMISQLVTNAARDGARVAATEGSTNATVQTAVQEFLADSLNLDPSDISIDISVSAGPGNPNPGASVSNAQQGDKCRVDVRVPFDKVTLTRPKWLSGKSLSGFCAMRKEW